MHHMPHVPTATALYTFVGSDIFETVNKRNQDLLEEDKLCQNSRLVINQNKSNQILWSCVFTT